MPIKGVHKVAVGDPMRASQHNELVDAFRSVTPHPVITEPFAEVFMGVIEALGPDDEADYADERYWVREQYISDTTGDHTDGFTLADVDIPTDGFGRWITAENLAEKAGATHSLAAGTFVQVFLAYDAASPGVVRYFFSQALPAELEWLAFDSYVQRWNTGAAPPWSSYTLEVDTANVIQLEQRGFWKFQDAPLKGDQIQSVKVPDTTLEVAVHWPNATAPPNPSFAVQCDFYLILDDYNAGTVAWGTQPTVQLIINPRMQLVGWADFANAGWNPANPAGWFAGDGIAEELTRTVETGTDFLTAATDYYGLAWRVSLATGTVGRHTSVGTPGYDRYGDFQCTTADARYMLTP